MIPAQHACPRCAAPILVGQIRCTHCGLDLNPAALAAWHAAQARSGPPSVPPTVVVQQRGTSAGTIILAVLGGLVVLGCLGIFGFCALTGGLAALGGQALNTQATAAAATQAALPPEAPITLQGTTSQSTAPFALQGGTYHIAWSCSNTDQLDQNFIADLQSTDNNILNRVAIANVIVPAGIKQSDTTNAYGVTAGTYYIKLLAADCAWTITLTQVR
jgi:hypothetical protein